MVIKKKKKKKAAKINGSDCVHVGWRAGPDEIDGFGHFWAEKKKLGK